MEQLESGQIDIHLGSNHSVERMASLLAKFDQEVWTDNYVWHRMRPMFHTNSSLIVLGSTLFQFVTNAKNRASLFLIASYGCARVGPIEGYNKCGKWDVPESFDATSCDYAFIESPLDFEKWKSNVSDINPQAFCQNITFAEQIIWRVPSTFKKIDYLMQCGNKKMTEIPKIWHKEEAYLKQLKMLNFVREMQKTKNNDHVDKVKDEEDEDDDDDDDEDDDDDYDRTTVNID